MFCNIPGGGRPPDSPPVEVPLYGPPPDVGDSSDGGEDGSEVWHNQDKDYQNGVVVGVRRLNFVTIFLLVTIASLRQVKFHNVSGY